MNHIDMAIHYYNNILERSSGDSKAIVGLFYCYYDNDRDLQKAGEVLKNNREIQRQGYYLRCCARLCKKLKRTDDLEQIKERLKKIGSKYVV